MKTKVLICTERIQTGDGMTMRLSGSMSAWKTGDLDGDAGTIQTDRTRSCHSVKKRGGDAFIEKKKTAGGTLEWVFFLGPYLL